MRFKICFAVFFIFVSSRSYAEMSVYDRKLEAALAANDIVQAEILLKKGANLESSGRLTWSQKIKPTKEMYNLFKKYKISMFGQSNRDRCVLEDVITSEVDENLLELVEFLVQSGEDVHCYRNDKGHESNLIYELANTLKFNSYKPRMDAIDYILEKGAKKDLNKYIKWFVSGFKGRTEIGKPMGNAISSELIILYLKHGTNPNEPIVMQNSDFSTQYVIHRIAHNNYIDAMKVLISKGGDLNIVDVNGYTALDYAHRNKSDDMELLLLENGGRYKKYGSLNR